MKLVEFKNKIKTEDFETVCLIIYDAVIDNKITQDQFNELMSDIVEEFEGQIDKDEFTDSFDIDGDDFTFDTDDDY
jgi:hypothetical protein